MRLIDASVAVTRRRALELGMTERGGRVLQCLGSLRRPQPGVDSPADLCAMHLGRTPPQLGPYAPATAWNLRVARTGRGNPRKLPRRRRHGPVRQALLRLVALNCPVKTRQRSEWERQRTLGASQLLRRPWGMGCHTMAPRASPSAAVAGMVSARSASVPSRAVEPSPLSASIARTGW